MIPKQEEAAKVIEKTEGKQIHVEKVIVNMRKDI
jgi:hypothetical protein